MSAPPALVSTTSSRPGMLVCADGTSFEGEWIGSAKPRSGELVFNTAMSGYQEVLSDPSYAGQVVAFTYPHIGNYGITTLDSESRRPWIQALVARDVTHQPSSWRSEQSLVEYLASWDVPILSGVDTRRLTRHIRDAGSMPCALGALEGQDSLSRGEILALAAQERGTEGIDLVSTVSTLEPYSVGNGPLRVVVYDFGVKSSILSQLATHCSVEIVPAKTSASDVLDRDPHGVVLSNGPGDPAALPWAVDTVRKLLGEVPIFGICLGHQLLGKALGGHTFKLPFGHHGANHPVQRLASGQVEITSQNHNYAVAEDGLDGASVSHRNLNDDVVEGLTCESERAFSVQFHPEAGPGPHDSRHLFAEFASMMRESGR